MRATVEKVKPLRSYFPIDDELASVVASKIPRSVRLPVADRKILLKGFEYLAEKVLPEFTPEKHAAIDEIMYANGKVLGTKFVIEFSTEADKIRFYKRLKHLKAELQKKVPKATIHYFHVATLVFRAFCKGEFPVEFN